jgi:DNA-binding response OmpR family regulator
VDDDGDLRDTLCEVVEAAGYDVYQAADGRQGLDFLLEGGPQPWVVLLDLMMPVMNGYQLLGELRHRGMAPAIIVMSAAPDRAALGGLTVLQKPFDLAQLVTAIAAHFS